MQPNIHPTYYKDVQVKCACGAAYTVGSTRQSYSLDICSACHPFYTGKQKLIDTTGRVDKFMARQKIAAARQAEMAERDSKREKIKVETVEEKIIRKVKAQEEAKMEEAAESTATLEVAAPAAMKKAKKPVVKAPKIPLKEKADKLAVKKAPAKKAKK